MLTSQTVLRLPRVRVFVAEETSLRADFWATTLLSGLRKEMNQITEEKRKRGLNNSVLGNKKD